VPADGVAERRGMLGLAIGQNALLTVFVAPHERFGHAEDGFTAALSSVR
jgi:hypothetical protein